LARGRRYREAGADCIFVPGVADAATIERLVDELGAPLNLLVGPQTPPLAELRRLGVARVSLGSRGMYAALSAFRDLAREVRDVGTFGTRPGTLTYAEANGLFHSRASIA
jgi:2-methylisocitrate lyase-like PEP mutase family enzyme